MNTHLYLYEGNSKQNCYVKIDQKDINNESILYLT